MLKVGFFFENNAKLCPFKTLKSLFKYSYKVKKLVNRLIFLST